MQSEIEQVLEAFEEAQVRYVVVGEVAVVLHGHLRTTADLDLVVQLERANVLCAVAALGKLGYRPRAPVPAESFADKAVREQWIREKGLTVGLEIDLFASEPFDFEAVHARSPTVRLERTAARVIGLEDLIDLKRKAARPRDVEDVRAPEAVRDAMEGRGGGKGDRVGEPAGDGFDHGWEGHRRRQAALGLSLAPAERLRWLVRTMDEMRGIQGRAREAEGPRTRARRPRDRRQGE